MDKTYDHKKTEDEIYKYWEGLGVFSPEKAQQVRKENGLETKMKPFVHLWPLQMLMQNFIVDILHM